MEFENYAERIKPLIDFNTYKTLFNRKIYSRQVGIC